MRSHTSSYQSLTRPTYELLAEHMGKSSRIQRNCSSSQLSAHQLGRSSSRGGLNLDHLVNIEPPAMYLSHTKTSAQSPYLQMNSFMPGGYHSSHSKDFQNSQQRATVFMPQSSMRAQVPLQGSNVLSHLSNLEQRTQCFQHRYLNEFYCLTCHKEVCSHCICVPGSSHHGHKSVQIKDFMTKAQQRQKDAKAMCEEIQAKYGNSKHAQKKTEQMKTAAKEKVRDLDKALDQKIEKSIEKLRTFQSEIKKRFSDLLISNIESVEKQQRRLLQTSDKGKALTKLMQHTLDNQQIGQSVEQSKGFNHALKELSKEQNQYEMIKKGCQDRRDVFRKDAENGLNDIVDLIESKIRDVNDNLDIPRFKGVELTNLNEDSSEELEFKDKSNSKSFSPNLSYNSKSTIQKPKKLKIKRVSRQENLNPENSETTNGNFISTKSTAFEGINQTSKQNRKGSANSHQVSKLKNDYN